MLHLHSKGLCGKFGGLSEFVIVLEDLKLNSYCFFNFKVQLSLAPNFKHIPFSISRAKLKSYMYLKFGRN